MLQYYRDRIEKFTISNIVKGIFLTIVSFLWGLISHQLTKMFNTWLERVYDKLVTTVTIKSSSIVYYDIIEYLCKYNIIDNLNNFTYSNGKWGYESVRRNIGYGFHKFNYKGVTFNVAITNGNPNNPSPNKVNTVDDMITIKAIGKHRDVIDDFIQNIVADNKKISKGSLVLNKISRERIETEPLQNKRSADTLYIDDNVKNEVIRLITEFRGNEDWYIQNGIPYKLSFLLYGPPGTGKTSFVKVIASMFDYAINYLSASNLDYVANISSNLSRDSILLIEDIHGSEAISMDTSSNTNDKSSSPDGDVQYARKYSKYQLPDILNGLDGIVETPGRILFVTANDISKIEPAVLRPGRIDYKFEIGYLSLACFTKMCYKLIPYFEFKKGYDYTILPKQTASDLQADILSKLPVDKILKKYTTCEKSTSSGTPFVTYPPLSLAPEQIIVPINI